MSKLASGLSLTFGSVSFDLKPPIKHRMPCPSKRDIRKMTESLLKQGQAMQYLWERERERKKGGGEVVYTILEPIT